MPNWFSTVSNGFLRSFKILWHREMAMREKRKDSTLPFGFLLDRDVSKAASLFPPRRTRTIAQAGLPENATDREIVEKAWKLGRTIVTRNGFEFVREIEKFLSETKRTDCHDMFGLVILPNGCESQKRLLPELEKKLWLDRKKITWSDVADLDCCVRVKKIGNPEVTRFERCFYCRKLGGQ